MGPAPSRHQAAQLISTHWVAKGHSKPLPNTETARTSPLRHRAQHRRCQQVRGLVAQGLRAKRSTLPVPVLPDLNQRRRGPLEMLVALAPRQARLWAVAAVDLAEAGHLALANLADLVETVASQPVWPEMPESQLP